jgi:hypothetical protein
VRASLLSLLVVASCGLVACEHEPPPKKAPAAQPTPPPADDPTHAAAPPATPPSAPPTAPPAAPPTAVDAGVDALPPVSQDCVDISAHIATVLIAEAKDPSQKATLEQEKTKIIRRSAEACTRDGWKPATLACFTKATTTEQMQVCARDLAAP